MFSFSNTLIHTDCVICIYITAVAFWSHDPVAGKLLVCTQSVAQRLPLASTSERWTQITAKFLLVSDKEGDCSRSTAEGATYRFMQHQLYEYLMDSAPRDLVKNSVTHV